MKYLPFRLWNKTCHLPARQYNLLTPARVETITSSPCAGNPMDLLAGHYCPAQNGGKIAWQSAVGPASPHRIRLSLKTPILMDSVGLVSLPKRSQDGNRHAIRDFDLEIIDHQHRIRNIPIRGNEDMEIFIPFRAGRVKRINLIIFGANVPSGDQVYNTYRSLYALMSIQAFYRKKPPTVSTSLAWEIEEGPAGRIALFEGNELNGPIPGIKTLRLLTELRHLGYGVTMITAAHLTAVPDDRDQSAWPFQLLINLAGAGFPAASWLYCALQKGCHLLSMGSLPFSDPWVFVQGRWQRLGLDLGITATAPDWVQDHASRSPEQLRFDVTRHRHINNAECLSGKEWPAPLTLYGCFSGHAVTADLGEILSIEQEQALVKEGLWSATNVQRRQRVAAQPLMYGVWGNDYNPIFQTPCARLVPLIRATDGKGLSYQGMAGAELINFAGRYRNSRWGLIEIDDFSGLKRTEAEAFHLWLAGLSQQLVHISRFSFIRPDRYRVSYGETVRAHVGITPSSPSGQPSQLEFTLKQADRIIAKRTHCERPLKRKQEINLSIPRHLQPGLLVIQATLKQNGQIIDCLETGVWVRRSSPKAWGPSLAYRQNVFRLNERPSLLLGARTDGFHQWGQPDENPLSWEDLFKQMRAMNLRVFSPVHLSYYESSGNLPATVWDIIETQAEMCRHHGIVFAPCLFFPGALACIRAKHLAIRLARQFARRMARFRGVFFYLFDDGLPHDAQAFNNWCAALRKAIAKERPGTLLTAEFVNHPRLFRLIKDTGRELDFLAISHHAMRPDPLPNMLVDSTLQGKATTNAEFGQYDPPETAESSHKYRLNLRLGIVQGQALLLNWMLRDPAHAQFPWGCLYAHDNQPKATGRTFWAESLLIAGQQPMPPVPRNDIVVLLPAKRMRFTQQQNAELVAGDVCLEEKLRFMIKAEIPFRIIDESELPLLSPLPRFLVIPRLTDPDDRLSAALQCMGAGGTILLWQRDGFRPDPAGLTNLIKAGRAIALDPGSPADFVRQVYGAIYRCEPKLDIQAPYHFTRHFRNMTYHLLADLEKQPTREMPERVRLENRLFSYRFDQDRLGVLLLDKGRLLGAVGFLSLATNGKALIDGAGTCYWLSLDSRDMGVSRSVLVFPQASGIYRIHSEKSEGSWELHQLGFNGAIPSLGRTQSVRRQSGWLTMEFGGEDILAPWVLTCNKRFQISLDQLTRRLSG